MSRRFGIPGTRAAQRALVGLSVFLLVAALPLGAWALVTIEAAKGCDSKGAPSSPVNTSAPGEFVDCTSTIKYADVDGDINEVTEPAFDAMDPADLPHLTCSEDPIPFSNRIVAVRGNAACSGASLPCIICDSFDTRFAPNGLQCPGDDAEGEIDFAHDDVCQIDSCPAPDGPTDPDPGFSVIDDASQIRIATTCAGQFNNQGGPENDVCADNVTFAANAQPEGKSFCSGCPVVEIEKTAECDKEDPANPLCRFSWVVTNVGDIPATNCEVIDTTEVPGEAPTALATLCPPLNPGEQCTGTFTLPLVQGTTNTATVLCDGQDGLPDDDPSPECPGDQDDAVCTCPGGDFKCYNMKLENRARFPRQDVTLDDQFGFRIANVLRPFEICNPVDKNDEGIGDPEAHLMCYKIFSRDRNREYVIDEDQFGEEELLVGGAIELCVPALKDCVPDPDAVPPVTCDLQELEDRLNHYQCYRARTARGAEPLPFPITVNLEDQFETKDTDLLQTSLHCNPVSKNGGPIPAPDDPDDPSAPGVHLKCYDIQDSEGQTPHGGASVTVEDQFGTWGVLAGRPTRLCEPARKELLP